MSPEKEKKKEKESLEQITKSYDAPEKRRSKSESEKKEQ
jgi:hypothetical protein